MGKKRQQEPPFCKTTEVLTDRSERLDKLRYDLWLSIVLQQKLISHIRNEITDCANSDARNVVYNWTELLREKVEKTEELTVGYLDHTISLYNKKREKKRRRKD